MAISLLIGKGGGMSYRAAVPEIEWKDLVCEWEYLCHLHPELGRELPVCQIPCQSVREGTTMYLYDLILKSQVEARKEEMDNFMQFGKLANKGTIYTMNMLRLAKSNEERMAIWCAAFAKDLFGNGKKFKEKYPYLFHIGLTCESFLRGKFELWHHAMKKLTPEIYYGFYMCEGVKIETWEALVELIALNAKMVLQDYQMVLYTSLKGEEVPVYIEETCNVRLDGE